MLKAFETLNGLLHPHPPEELAEELEKSFRLSIGNLMDSGLHFNMRHDMIQYLTNPKMLRDVINKTNENPSFFTPPLSQATIKKLQEQLWKVSCEYK